MKRLSPSTTLDRQYVIAPMKPTHKKILSRQAFSSVGTELFPYLSYLDSAATYVKVDKVLYLVHADLDLAERNKEKKIVSKKKNMLNIFSPENKYM